jgi:hypothetical protein
MHLGYLQRDILSRHPTGCHLLYPIGTLRGLDLLSLSLSLSHTHTHTHMHRDTETLSVPVRPGRARRLLLRLRAGIGEKAQALSIWWSKYQN